MLLFASSLIGRKTLDLISCLGEQDVFNVNDFEDSAHLTQRESQVLELVACGLSSKEVAQHIGIAPRTVDRHVENLRHKMRAKNKTHMVTMAVLNGDLSLRSRNEYEQPILPGLDLPRA